MKNTFQIKCTCKNYLKNVHVAIYSIQINNLSFLDRTVEKKKKFNFLLLNSLPLYINEFISITCNKLSLL